ncbi:BTAD domain-containing putative transcriptional regulator [Actinomadura algeriensis]|uniref:ATPase/DNA-binding SARP family transcriptional activator n=1 Tax=Actinomadura algeriensis TaxID=1679523 RepID=A0ABR9K1J6_9ACTN|nr:BTAD domain-containing putative transcriptional regulator [Actinomadura algeriensis]MBE1536708.1 putative ATPase/DNA-binding SARP family transcriptional activator [Actinomadura algeriensis]
MRYEFGILGPLSVTRDGARVSIGSGMQRSLLAALLVDAGQVVSVDSLVGRLWGESPPRGARNAVQNYVLRVRRALGPDVVVTDRRGYLVDVAPDRLDAHRFAALVRRGADAATGGESERAAALLGEALGLWRGDPLADLAAERFQDVVPALCEQRLAAQELWIDAVIRCGRPADVLPQLHRLTECHPLRERFWSQRMLALYRCGRQGEALECYRQVARLLADELGIDPGDELRTLHRRMLTCAPEIAAPPSGAVPPPAAPPPPEAVPIGPIGNLPAETTSFIGRERELAETRRLLRTSRLVTLTGVGGVGKTRLALRAAGQVAPFFPEGVWLADLAALTDPTLVERAVAASLGLRDQSVRSAVDALADHVRDRHLLLVLDNCEHLVEPVAELVLRLLCAAPRLRVLATSRERLGVPGEHVLLVSGLTVHGGTGEGTCEAVRLLIDRAAACAAPLRAGERDGAVAADLCRRLDGIPLAIELAAVRLTSLTVEEIVQRLEDRFRLLAVPRAPASSHYRRTLRGVMDLSYGLCTPGERLLWTRLAVFAGSFDLPAAEAVCAGDGIDDADVLDLLTGLIHKSVVLAYVKGGAVRYRLLETIRQYGLDRLRADGGDTAYRIRHSDHFRALASRGAADWCSPREVEWLDRLRTELPNCRAALSFCLAHPGRARTGAEIAVDLTRSRSWFFSATLGEARHWLETLSADACAREAALPALVMKTFVACVQGDRAAAATFLEECRAAAAPGVPAAVTYVEGVHGLLALGDPACIDRFARVREEFRAAGHSGDAHMATMFWALAAAFLGDRSTAVSVCDAYVAEADASGAEWARTWAQWCTGLTEFLHGDPGRAPVPLCDALVRQQAVHDHWGPAWIVETLAWTVGALGHHHHAARLLGAAHRQRQATGAALAGLKPLLALHTRTTAQLREHLGASAYAEAWRHGAGSEDPVAFSLGIAHKIFRRTAGDPGPVR